MKRAVCLLVGAVMVLLLGSALALGDVEVHFHETPPDDWNERNLFRLTMFRTTYNDAMLLECGGQTMIVDSGTKKWTKSLCAHTGKRTWWMKTAMCMWIASLSRIPMTIMWAAPSGWWKTG